MVTANWQRSATQINDTGNLDDIVKQAGLDFNVERVPLHTDDFARLRVKGRVAHVRVDPDGERRVIGVVSDKYRMMHNVDAIAPFEYLVRQTGARVTRAGTVGHGRLSYVFAQLPRPVQIAPGDFMRQDILWTNSYDASTPISIMMAPTRLVCRNQIVLMKHRGLGFTIRHGANVHERTREAARVMGQMLSGYDGVTQRMRAMVQVPMNTERLRQYHELVTLLPDDPAEQPRVQKLHEDWADRFENGIGMGSDRRTLYHAMQGVIEAVDHKPLSRRVKNPTWFATLGSGGNLKRRAWAAAERMLAVSNN